MLIYFNCCKKAHQVIPHLPDCRDHRICEIPALIHISPLLNSWTFLLCLELSHSIYKPLIFNLFLYLSALTETRLSPEDTCFLATLSGGGCLLLKLPHTAQPEEKELSLFSTLPLRDHSPCFTLLECITWGASLHHLQWSHFMNLTAGTAVSSMLPCQISQWYQCTPSRSFQSTGLLVPWTLL